MRASKGSLDPAATLVLDVVPVRPSVAPRNRSERWTLAGEVFAALLVNLLLIVALFVRIPVKSPPVEHPPVISVDLVKPPEAQPKPKPAPPQPKLEEPKPQQQKQMETKFQNRESGGNPDVKSGRKLKVDAPKTKEPAQHELKKPKPVAPKPQVEVPDWARKLAPGYDLPQSTMTRAAKAQGGETDNRFSDSVGEGGGDRYLNAMRDRIISRFNLPREALQRVRSRARFSVVLNRDGMLVQIRMVESSGSAEFDQALANAISDAAPFAPPPDFPGNYLALEFSMDPRH